MEDEIDGLDLEKNYTGEKESAEVETPKEPEEKEPEQKADEGKETPKEEDEPGEPEVKENDTKDKGLFGVKGHTPEGVQRRINELSRSNREQKEQIARLTAELEGFKKQLPQQKEKTRDDFANDEELIDYRAEIKARGMFESMRTRERDEAELAEAKAAFAKSEEDARTRLFDYDDVMSKDVNIPVDRDTYMYVNRSPLGADILYTLKKIESVRNQFLMTPEAGKIAFVKQVEERIRQIREGQPAHTQTPQQAPAEVPPKAPEPPKPALRQPQEVRQPVSRAINPATCSMDEWMENGD